MWKPPDGWKIAVDVPEYVGSLDAEMWLCRKQ